ncbi:MAG: hypothetical protein HQL17_03355 [Candidatus Omnitrophica bacterium]|nr:hypothetical protein [Candidatus Omnitrophota bacterium]
MKIISVVLFLTCFFSTYALAQESEAGRLDALRSQADVQRARENDLQLLQMEVERLKLEVEKKKAMAELGTPSAPGSNVPSAASGGVNAVPVVSLKYVFMSGAVAEAVLEIDGRERRVKTGDEIPLGVVRSMSAEGVTVAGKDGAQKTLTLR